MVQMVHVKTVLTTRELADRWQLHPGTLRNMRSQGRGPSTFRIGRRVRYLLHVIESYEKKKR